MIEVRTISLLLLLLLLLLLQNSRSVYAACNVPRGRQCPVLDLCSTERHSRCQTDLDSTPVIIQHTQHNMQLFHETVSRLYGAPKNLHKRLSRSVPNVTRISAVAVIADRTAYHVQYSCRPLAGIAVVSMSICLLTVSN